MVTTSAAPPPRDLYPFEGRRFDRGGGIRMHFHDEGQGPPVVLLHGNPSWSFLWRDLVKDLRRDHRCVAPDHVGCGLSDAPGAGDYGYALGDRIADVDALLRHLGIGGRVTLVLHDWGGMIGMAWAARNPDRVARLVLMNTAAFRSPAPVPRELFMAMKPILGPFLVRDLNLFVRGAIRRCTVKPLPQEVADAYRAPHASRARRLSVLRFVRDIPLFPKHPSWPILEETERALPRFAGTPMLLCWGMQDFVFERPFLEEWTRRFPGAEVHRFEDAGHWLLEDAGDRIVPLVRRFLEAHPA